MNIQIICSFLVSGSASVLNNVKKKYFFLCGFSGIVANITYNLFITNNNAAIASLVSCIAVLIFSQFCSYFIKIPSTIFTISGIMPIVPGSLLFKSFDSLVQNSYDKAIDFGVQAILVGVSIAIGFFINGVVSNILMNLKNKIK